MIKLAWTLVTLFLVFETPIGFAQSEAIRESEWIMHQDSFQLSGTLTVPQNSRPVAVLLIRGSGPPDRVGNNPFMKDNSSQGLSDSLLVEGFTTIGFAERGIGKRA